MHSNCKSQAGHHHRGIMSSGRKVFGSLIIVPPTCSAQHQSQGVCLSLSELDLVLHFVQKQVPGSFIFELSPHRVIFQRQYGTSHPVCLVIIGQFLLQFVIFVSVIRHHKNVGLVSVALI